MNPLDQLHDIQVSEHVSSWPLAWGWWVLLTLAVIGLASLIIGFVRRYQANRFRRAAIAHLKELDKAQPEALHVEVNKTLKSVVRHYFSRDSVSSLHGTQWQQFLLSRVKPSVAEKLKDDLSHIQAVMYQPTEQVSRALQHAYLESALLWLKKANLRNTDKGAENV